MIFLTERESSVFILIFKILILPHFIIIYISVTSLFLKDDTIGTLLVLYFDLMLKGSHGSVELQTEITWLRNTAVSYQTKSYICETH